MIVKPTAPEPFFYSNGTQATTVPASYARYANYRLLSRLGLLPEHDGRSAFEAEELQQIKADVGALSGRKILDTVKDLTPAGREELYDGITMDLYRATNQAPKLDYSMSSIPLYLSMMASCHVMTGDRELLFRISSNLTDGAGGRIEPLVRTQVQLVQDSLVAETPVAAIVRAFPEQAGILPAKIHDLGTVSALKHPVFTAVETDNGLSPGVGLSMEYAGYKKFQMILNNFTREITLGSNSLGLLVVERSELGMLLDGTKTPWLRFLNSQAAPALQIVAEARAHFGGDGQQLSVSELARFASTRKVGQSAERGVLERPRSCDTLVARSKDFKHDDDLVGAGVQLCRTLFSYPLRPETEYVKSHPEIVQLAKAAGEHKIPRISGVPHLT